MQCREAEAGAELALQEELALGTLGIRSLRALHHGTCRHATAH